MASGDELALPRGFRDILPTEARELHAIRDGLMRAFGSYGYVPLEPPSVEHARAASNVDERRLIRFLDQGSLLALRPDLTTAIARVVAQRYREVDGALRLSYFTSVFRQDRSMRGSEREYDQAGVELVGVAGTLGDAEVLALLCEALTSLGLRDFSIEAGHIGAVRAVFGALREDARETVLARLRAGEHAEALREAARVGMSGEALERARAALGAHGRGIEGVDVPEATELREAIHLARELFAGEPLWGVPNLSVIPALPYYTGVVFEAVSPHAGAPIAAGGRYDGLLDLDRPATGFAIAVPLLHQALVAQGWAPTDGAPLISLEGGDDPARLRLARTLRAEGVAVALGRVAESAGRRVIAVRVIDDHTVELDGRRMSPSELRGLA